MCINYYLATDNLSPDPGPVIMPQQKVSKLRPILPKGQVPTATISRPLEESKQNIINIDPIPCEKIKNEPEEQQLVPYQQNEDSFENDPDMPSDFDLMKYVVDLQQQEEKQMLVSTQHETCDGNEISTTLTSIQKTFKRSPNIPVFNNCKIGSITININKN